jgi:hypothetical protein
VVGARAGGGRWTVGAGAGHVAPGVRHLNTNPFNPATTIPFSLSAELFAEGHRPKVSLRVYNVLAQLVAVPILQGSGERLENVELTCGDPAGCSYAAYWDGTVLNTGQEAASGVYIYQLIVDGRRFTRKMVVMK